MNILTSQPADFQRTTAKTLMANLLITYPAVNVVYAHNDDMALGAIEAIEEAGKIPGADIILVSIDGCYAAFEAMVAGKLDCTVECSPLFGPLVFDTIEKILRGEVIDKLIIQTDNVFTKETAAIDILNRVDYY